MFRFMPSFLAVSLLCSVVFADVSTVEPKTVTPLKSVVDFPVPKVSRKAERCKRKIFDMMEAMPHPICCGNDERLVRLRNYVSEHRKEAIPALIQTALLTTDGKLQNQSIWTLSELGAPETLPFFRALSCCDVERYRLLATCAFERIYPNDHRVVVDIMRCLRDESPWVRCSALGAAENVADPRLLGRIATLFRDPDQNVRCLAYQQWLALQPSLSFGEFKKLIEQANPTEQIVILRATHKVDRQGEAGEQLVDILLSMLASQDESLCIEADAQLLSIRNDPIVRERLEREFDWPESPLWKSVRTLGSAGWDAESKGALHKALAAYRAGLANYRQIENKKKLRINFDEGATFAFRIIRIYQKQGRIQEAIRACEAMAEEFDASTGVYARDYPIPGTCMVRTAKEVQEGLLAELRSTPDPH